MLAPTPPKNRLLPHAHSGWRPGRSESSPSDRPASAKDSAHLSSGPTEHESVGSVTLSFGMFDDLAEDLVPLVDLVIHVQLVVFLMSKDSSP